MLENRTKLTDASVESYYSAIKDEARRKDCEALTKLLTRATKQPPKMWGCLQIRQLSDVDPKILEQLVVGSVAERKRHYSQG